MDVDLKTGWGKNLLKTKNLFFKNKITALLKNPKYMAFIPKPAFFLTLCTNVSSFIFQFLV